MWCPTLNKFAEGMTLCSVVVSVEPNIVCAYSSGHAAGHIACEQALSSCLCLSMPDMHLAYFRQMPASIGILSAAGKASA